MAVTAEDIAFVRDLFSGLPALTTRKMFGGLSVYSEGQIFAIIGPENRIYIKASGPLAEALAAEGGAQFVYEGKEKTASMGYWTLPESALDDPDEAADWARRALDAAVRG
ncbi:MAG: TfoX/Sxy family protein [Pseudomonadota bacterium]